MASKPSKAAAAETPDVDPQVNEAPAETTPAKTEAPVEPEGVDIAQINAETFVQMIHPDGGTCDLYETNAQGHLLVPVLEIADMVSHGFAVVTEG